MECNSLPFDQLSAERYLSNMLAKSRILYIKPTSSRLFSHVPVMAEEIIELIKPTDGKVYIDMTFGGGGHTRRLLETNKSIKVIAVDRDPIAYKEAQELSKQTAIKSERLNISQSVVPIHGKFSQVLRDIHLSGVPYGSVDGVIFDLGSSSMQYDDPNRGFSLSGNGPLDMRMDTSNQSDMTAEDVVNNMNQENLALLFKTLGEERRSRKIANAIVDARTLLGRIKSTHELAKVVASSSYSGVDSMGRFSHPATKVFQALRIFVNNELNELNYALEKIREFLKPAQLESGDEENLKSCGVAAVLTFHSLEDRIVKRHFSSIDLDEPIIKCLSQHDRIRTNYFNTDKQVRLLNAVKNWRPILKHVKKPRDEEIAANPRSRSAKLRAAIRIQ